MKRFIRLTTNGENSYIRVGDIKAIAREHAKLNTMIWFGKREFILVQEFPDEVYRRMRKKRDEENKSEPTTEDSDAK